VASFAAHYPRSAGSSQLAVPDRTRPRVSMLPVGQSQVSEHIVCVPNRQQVSGAIGSHWAWPQSRRIESAWRRLGRAWLDASLFLYAGLAQAQEKSARSRRAVGLVRKERGTGRSKARATRAYCVPTTKEATQLAR
jgi:hypothetical protein